MDDLKMLKNLKAACLRKVLENEDFTARLHVILARKVANYRYGSHSLATLEEGEMLCGRLRRMADGESISMSDLGKLADKREAMTRALVKNGVTIADMKQAFGENGAPDLLGKAIAVRNRIVLENRNLVYATIKRTLGKEAMRDEDLGSAGMEGLLEAADRYNPDLQLQFNTYASRWIRKRIFEEVRHKTQTPDGYSTVAAYLKKYLDNESPDIETLMTLTGLPETTVKRAIEHFARKMVSLDFAPNRDGASLSEILSDPDQESPEDMAARRELFTKIADIIENLPVKTSHKVVLHAHLIEGKTLADAGAEAGMCTANVQRLANKYRGSIAKRLGWAPG